MEKNMSIGTLEHANITVSEPQRLARLLRDLLGWQVRWEGKSASGGDTIHIGDERAYLAIYADDTSRAHQAKGAGYSKGQPLNHLAFVVEDLAGAEEAVNAHGLAPFGHDNYDPGERFYFYDWDGIEFEVVSYSGGSASLGAHPQTAAKGSRA